ncbi:RING/FYVE/PHD zinc finger superfamily protein [Wolffia australiana]
MGGHFALLVDRLLTESSLPAAMAAGGAKGCDLGFIPQERKQEDEINAIEMAECRICQEEDLQSNVEAPCFCCGSLKYAHRKCIQRWCDEKGDTICEICLQPFEPNYTAPPKLLQYGSMPMAFRGNWGISRQSLHSPHFIAAVEAEEDFADSDYEGHSSSHTRSIIFCRSVAVILSVLVVVSHTLPIFMSFGDEWWYSVAEILFLVMRTAGILLPVVIMTRTLLAFHRRHRQLVWE